MTVRVTRVLIAALLAEILSIVLLLLIVVPLVLASEPPALQAGERMARRIVVWALPLSALVSCLFGGWWAARRLDADHLRHGIFTGLGAVTLDIVWLALLGAPFQAAFAVAEILRVAGGAAGGWLASRRRVRGARGVRVGGSP